MFPIIYIEHGIKDHPRVQKICEKFPDTPKVFCEHYGEIFNKRSNHFRLQKRKPSLILARKHKNHILPIPQGYGIGGAHNFYFSHMLNCLYDCRYCFLQGMYSSAHYVLFINYEDFHEAILRQLTSKPEDNIYFFSGYDCDSLAMESITDFFGSFYSLFSENPRAYLELRTKSFNIQKLLTKQPLPNCITAFTLTPEPIAKSLEHKAPPLAKRIEAIQKLQAHDWPVGIRLDPLIYCKNYQEHYEKFLHSLFSKINPTSLHSITLGTFRLPKPVFKSILRLYPEEPLFGCGLNETGNQISYSQEKEQEMLSFCSKLLLEYVPSSILFPMQ